MKLKKIYNGIESLIYLTEQKLPVKISFDIAVLTKRVAPEIDAFNKIRVEKVKEYGEPIDKLDDKGIVMKNKKGEIIKDTDRFNLKRENIEKFNKEMEELLDKDVDIKIPTIKIKDFGNIEIEPKYLIQLDWLIE